MGDNESSVAEMANRLSKQEAFISELEMELSALQTGFETERTNQNQQVCRLCSDHWALATQLTCLLAYRWGSPLNSPKGSDDLIYPICVIQQTVVQS